MSEQAKQLTQSSEPRASYDQELQSRARFERTICTGLDYWRLRTKELDDQAIGLLDTERHNLYRVVQFGLALPEAWSRTAEVVVQSIPLVNRRMYWDEWVPVMEQLIRQCPAGGESLKFQLLTQLGRCQRMLRQLDEALASHWAAEVLANDIGDKLAQAEAAYNIGRVYLLKRQYDKVDKYSRLALTRLEGVGPAGNGLVALSNNSLGFSALRRGDLEEAEMYLARTVSIWRTIGDITRLSRALSDLAIALQNAGRYEEAIAHYEEAEQLLKPTSNELDKSLIRSNLGVLHFKREDWRAAEASFKMADSDYLRRSGNVNYRARISASLGNVMLKQERWTEAESYLRPAISLFERSNDDLGMANAVGSLGEVLAGRGQPEAAVPLFDRAISLLEQYGELPQASNLREMFTEERKKALETLTG